jgi:hypothetical protein
LKKNAMAKPRMAATAGPFSPVSSGLETRPMIQNANITLMTSHRRAPKLRRNSCQSIRIFDPATAWEISSR